LATTADAFYTAAAMRPVGYASDDGDELSTWTPKETVGISPEALVLVNERLPLSRIVDASATGAWPAILRRNALSAAFARALLLDDAEALRRVDADVRATWPELGPEIDGVAKATGDERRFVIARLFLRYPGLRPFMTGGERRMDLDFTKTPPKPAYQALSAFEELRDNWWCGFPASPSRTGASERGSYQPGIYSGDVAAPGLPWPGFLTPDEKARAEREWKTLSTIDAAPEYLGHEVLAWAAAHPADARLAEALHRVVRATRSGCTTEKTGDVSKQAFTVLHKRFPASEWAAKTPYWFH
jgi:hypothetical protein